MRVKRCDCPKRVRCGHLFAPAGDPSTTTIPYRQAYGRRAYRHGVIYVTAVSGMSCTLHELARFLKCNTICNSSRFRGRHRLDVLDVLGCDSSRHTAAMGLNLHLGGATRDHCWCCNAMRRATQSIGRCKRRQASCSEVMYSEPYPDRLSGAHL